MVRTPLPFRGAAAALAAALILCGGAAVAQDVSDGLPPASAKNWTSERLTRDKPPGINGAIAQVRGKGEGRFAIVCRKGERKAMMAFLPPKAERKRIDEGDDVLDVTFTFDGDEQVNRKLRQTDPPFWTGDFGPSSRLAKLMKQTYRVNVNARRYPGVDSDYTLDKSWVSIEEMFAICSR